MATYNNEFNTVYIYHNYRHYFSYIYPEKNLDQILHEILTIFIICRLRFIEDRGRVIKKTVNKVRIPWTDDFKNQVFSYV